MIAFCKFTVRTSPPEDSKTNSAKFVAGYKSKKDMKNNHQLVSL